MGYDFAERSISALKLQNDWLFSIFLIYFKLYQCILLLCPGCLSPIIYLVNLFQIILVYNIQLHIYCCYPFYLCCFVTVFFLTIFRYLPHYEAYFGHSIWDEYFLHFFNLKQFILVRSIFPNGNRSNLFSQYSSELRSN